MQVHLTSKRPLYSDWEHFCSVNRVIIVSNQNHMHVVLLCRSQNNNFMMLLVPRVHVKSKYVVKWNM
jgi:hypothetical protein